MTKNNLTLNSIFKKILILGLVAISIFGITTNISTQAVKQKNLKYFGYYATNSGELNNSNISEIGKLNNSNTIVVDYSPNIILDTVRKAEKSKLKIILHVSGYFFDYSVKPTILRSDYISLTSALKDKLGQNISQIQSFYFDEPLWQGISKSDFKSITLALKQNFPDTARMSVEAIAPLRTNTPYTSPYGISNIYLDSDYLEYITDVGFDYFVFSCQSTDRSHQSVLDILQTLANKNQNIWLIPDGAINLSCNSDSSLLRKSLTYYYNIAKINPRVVGILSWTYSGYTPSQTIENIGYIGLKDIFNQNSQYYDKEIRNEHIKIGKNIT